MPAPTFAQVSYSGTVAENTAAGAALGTVAATAGGNPIVYSITDGNQAGFYSIDPDTGAVTTTGPLNYEAVRSSALTITAVDRTDGATALASFAVAVTNVDESPTPGAPFAPTVAEDVPVNTLVGTVSASDPDRAAPITYGLTTQNVPFEVDPATGEVRTTAALDHETSPFYNLAFAASDGTSTDTTINGTVTVGNVDERPTAGAPVSPLSVGENLAAGTRVGFVSAIDPDGAALEYALTTEDIPFIVDPATGEVTTTAPLDHEEAASYRLEFTASDGTTEPTPFTATVSVTNVDESPTTGAPARFSAAENLPAGARVGTLSASDPERELVTYALTTQNGPFVVDPATGEITTTAPLDRELTASYTLAFTASDGTSASTPLSATVAVADVNEAPVPGHATSFTVGENLPAGATVGTVSAADPENAAAGYTLATSGVPFRVNAVTGRITTTQALDHEQLASYNLTVRATDGVNTTPIAVTIGVNDANEAPVPAAVGPFDISENLAAGTVVGTVSANDPEGGALNYTLASTGVPFVVNSAGQITTTAVLDREQVASYALTINAFDGTNATPLAVAVNVVNQDEPPVSTATGPVTLPEDAPAGTVVGTVSGTDPEGTPLAYALTTRDVPFAVDTATGQITTTDPLNYEATTLYNLAVTATDATGQSTPVSLAVSVSDVNEAPVPGANGPYEVRENLPAGAVVGTAAATNPEDSTVGYTLTTAGVPFEVDAVSGRITTTAAMDREAVASYALEVEATDGETITPIAIAVNVGNEDEAPAPGAPVAASLAENVAVGSVVGTVSATDPEGVPLTYALATQDVPFAVDPATGEIRTTAALNFEAATSYNLALSAFDGANTVPLAAAFTLTNVDEAPDFALVPPASVAENRPAGAPVATVSASDPESAAMTYALATQNVPFAVDPATGDITTTGPLDREATASYDLAVTATDATGNASTATVPVVVLDVNEAPTATGGPSSFTVAENLPAGARVGRVSATDPEDAPLGYTLTTQGVPFAVDAVTGVVTTTAALNREQLGSYSLAFTASDGSNATALNATVTVSDVDEAPVAGAPASFSVAENAAAGAVLGRVSAADPEGAALRYALATPDVPFVVDAATGEVRTTAALDREARDSYTLALTASDGANTTTLSASVAVDDVNEAPTAGAPASLSVAENLAAGAVVGRVSATDPEGAALRYALTTEGALFGVDAATGEVRTTAALDREQLGSYTLAFTASDDANPAVAFGATVAVADVDEAPANARTTGALAAVEGVAGTAVGTVSATDPEGAALTYAIASGNEDGAFAADARTGAITTTDAFGYGVATSRALGLTASDGTNSLAIPVTVVIEQVPDAPVFTAAEAAVAEDAAVGTVLGRFSVPNAGGAGVAFTGQPSRAYAVAADGTVTLRTALDYEAAQALPVSATAAFAGNSGPSAVSAIGTGTVAVADVYEAADRGQAAPPAPLALDGGTATVDGTAAGFAVRDGELAFTGGNGATTVVPGVERANFADGALSFASDTPEAFLQRLYIGLLGREADGRGIAYQAERLDDGATPGQVAQGFVDSPEYAGNANGTVTDRAFVEELYVNFLDRQADEEGATYWTNALATGAVTRGDIAAEFAGSREAQAKYEAQTSRGIWVADWEDLELDALFVAGLGREAEPEAREAVTRSLEAGILTREALAEAIADSAEFRARHDGGAEDAVNTIFRDALERDADPGALAYFVPVYQSQGADAVLLAVTSSQEFALVEDYRASGEYLFD